MRLRPRTQRTMGVDWVQPRGSGRSTTIGNLDSPVRGSVDPAGLVTLDAAGWSLDWWIGAEDRWHLPCREVAVRQSLVGGSPVVETRLRVPSGDAVHRAYAARAGDGSEALVIEVENQSKVPFALALAVRPHTQTGPGRIDEVRVDGTAVLVDQRVVLVLPKSPGRIALSDASADAAQIVFAGDAAPPGAALVACAEGLAHGVLLFPLTHSATLRVVLPINASPEPPPPAAYPSAEQVASGWSSHAAGGTRVELPDRRLRDAVVASTRHLLLGGRGAEVAAALDLMGCAAEAGRMLLADPIDLSRREPPGAALHAVVRHWELTRDLAFAGTMVEVVAVLVSRLASAPPADAGLGGTALAGASDLLAAAGEARAAADVRAVVIAAAPPAPIDLHELLAVASSTWTWAAPTAGHDLYGNAAIVTGVRDLLVLEHPQGLHLSPVVADSWLGQSWELHDAPTAHGRLSFAVRWHGDRPALLWDLAPHHDDAAIALTAPALDPSWRTTERSGEALLSAVAIPDRGPRRGLTIPVSIEPSPRRAD